VRIAVTGSSGLIGTALVQLLEAGGHDVVRLVRRPPRGTHEVRWDPEVGTVDQAGLAGVEAAVHLAGAGVGDHRWTPAYKQAIRDSRVLGTRTLVRALTQLDPLPSVLVSGSAQGFYGDRGDELLSEDSTGGSGFLADVVRAWEAETAPASEAGIRVALARTGLVMAPSGGAFGRLMPLPSGRQWWSWITLDDEVAAFEHLLTAEVSGPVNLCAPEPLRQKDLTARIAHALHRPSLLPAPSLALRIALGEFAADVLASVRMAPDRLQASGFAYQHATVDDATKWLVSAPH